MDSRGLGLPKKAGSFLSCFALLVMQGILIAHVGIISVCSYSQPAYARPDAFANYDLQGGYVPFFEGVNGTFDYTVKAVYPNGSMQVNLVENVSMGNELPTAGNVSNFLDAVFSPRMFPALPASDLNSTNIIFDNQSSTFVKNYSQTVPAGTFETAEYAARDSNGTQFYFFIDRSTGLAVEMEGNGVIEQLAATNIATPLVAQSDFSNAIGYVEVFAVGWLLAAALFLAVRHYYKSKSRIGTVPEAGNKQDRQRANAKS